MIIKYKYQEMMICSLSIKYVVNDLNFNKQIMNANKMVKKFVDVCQEKSWLRLYDTYISALNDAVAKKQVFSSKMESTQHFSQPLDIIGNSLIEDDEFVNGEEKAERQILQFLEHRISYDELMNQIQRLLANKEITHEEMQ